MRKRKGSVPTNRRKFLGVVGGATAAAVVTNVVGLPTLSVLTEPEARAADIGPQGGRARAERAEEIRARVAEAESNVEIPHHRDNGDEVRYANKIGNHSKNLTHDPNTGEVDLNAYEAFLGALSSGRFLDFEALATNGHFGCTDPTRQRRLVNPEAGYAFDLEGTDSHQLALPPAPAFASAQEAGEMIFRIFPIFGGRKSGVTSRHRRCSATIIPAASLVRTSRNSYCSLWVSGRSVLIRGFKLFRQMLTT